MSIWAIFAQTVPFTNQQRLAFAVSLPLWARRGPAPQAGSRMARPAVSSLARPVNTEAAKEEACEPNEPGTSRSVWG